MSRSAGVCDYVKKPRFLTTIFAWMTWIFAWMTWPTLSMASLTDGPLGKIDLSVNAGAKYDSNVFSMPSSTFNVHKKTSSSLKSSGDLMLSLTPAAHFSTKIKMIEIRGMLGARATQFIRNRDKSYIDPITSLSIDFDETLSKQKRISNNAKIRFDAVFDIGQKTATSVLENDLMSYTYLSLGLNARYNHSPKFGVGASTSYSYRDYQSETGVNPYQDVSTTPISTRAFYIYSPKLDFFTEYIYSPTRGGRSTNQTLDSTTHTVNFGAQGDLFTKASGSFRIGRVIKTYDKNFPSQSSLSMAVGLSWNLNQKTSVSINSNRSFQPSPQDRSILTTSAGITVSHRLNEKMTGTAMASWSSSDYTTGIRPGVLTSGGNLKTVTVGATMNKTLSQRFSVGGGYNFSTSQQSFGDFDRHVLHVDFSGRY